MTEPDDERRIQRVMASLPARLDNLLAAPARPRDQHHAIPTGRGVYLFSEAGSPIYVGRSRNLKTRIGEHVLPGGGRETATFAFQIARKRAEADGIETNIGRAELARDPEFSPYFSAAKEHVRQMDVRFIALNDPITEAMFEIYAAVVLGTDRSYNSFETH